MPKTFLFDTNALIDIVDSGRPGHAEALELAGRCGAGGPANAITLASSLKDVYYVLRRVYGDERRAREDVRLLMELVEPADLRAAYARAAIESDEPDFEDGLVRSASESLAVDAIVTRDARAFSRSPVPHMPAAELLGFI